MKGKEPASVPYEPYLLENLKDIEYAAGYLNACLDGNSDEDFRVFFEAVKNIAKAHGAQNVARKNPTIQNFRQMLHSMGMEFQIVPRKA